MRLLQQTYRTCRIIVPLFALVPHLIYSQSASPQAPKVPVSDQPPAIATAPDRQSAIETAPDRQSAIETAPDRQSAIAVEAMSAAIEQQRQAARKQIGGTVATDAFFSVPWTTPASIPLPALVPGCSPMADADLTPLIASNAKQQGVKPELIRAVIRHESASYPCAVSYRGALGLMQLMPDVADSFKADPLDPIQNVRAGTEYLKQLLTRYKGDVKLALAAYNAGPERVDAAKKVPEIAETVAYVDGILKDLDQNAASAH